MENNFKAKFDLINNKLINTIPRLKKDVDFNIKNKKIKNSISNVIPNIERLLSKEFGSGFIILPFYEDEFLYDADNYTKFKKSIKDTIAKSKSRWVLHKISTKHKLNFYNFSVDDIGYKAGKKGSKDKPNELMSILDEKGNKIYNLKYSHSWDKIVTNDKNTVLGIIKELKIWE